ncbi:FecR domain-containing protein [Jeongeupia naejangsanensis]|uniref:FecR domain-containing protein n=1 Tax=Jeongeupia naejangsanensis TaxID=613195 RepID=A0ABS2BP46_9NEIS|nr:FecR domain-containing protein [Jeongeupia naejangsanensis]MBM3117328.1 FecR domain-containing protein [Jeongeupia naejangsanensis]
MNTEPDRAALRQAAAWYAQFCSGEATASDTADWQAWLAAAPAHRAAWQRVEHLQARLQQLPAPIAAGALQRAPHDPAMQRRRALKLVVFGLGGGVIALGSRHWLPWGQADYRTAAGERREIRLADGSTLWLDTASAADVRFDAALRRVRLRDGEILIRTAKDAQQRPFVVNTGHGRIRALGTEFTVRTGDDATVVTVLADVVEITPAALSGPAATLRAGQTLRFTASGVGPVEAAGPAPAAWINGRLIVDDRPLAEVLAEIGRYRRGLLQCDPAVAGLRVSGAFDLADTDAALAALAQTFPVRLGYRSRWWVRVDPA